MSTPVVMFENMKGGVGKTALAISVAYEWAYSYDKNVLLIDFDPQSNASLALLGPGRYFSEIEQDHSLATVLTPGAMPENPFEVLVPARHTPPLLPQASVHIRRWFYWGPPRQLAGNLHLVPGHLDLMRLALTQVSGATETRLMQGWKQLLKEARADHDCVVIDCHPAGSFFTKAALTTSDAVVIPVTADGYATAGLDMMRRTVESWVSAGGARHYFVLFNDVHHSWDDDVENTIRTDPRYQDKCLATRIKYSSLVRNIAKRRQFVREQKVSYRRTVTANISIAAQELAARLRDVDVFDSTWIEQ